MNVLNEKVYYACSQVKLLNQEIDLLNIRYLKALTNKEPSFRYSLRLQLATHEGVRGLFYNMLVCLLERWITLKKQ